MPGQTLASRRGEQRFLAPSMEGRAIARPNGGWLESLHGLSGGLQWRAGQLPGQTCRQRLRTRARRRRPSMEGRAIARPNPSSDRPAPGSGPAFNGGPGNCPAKRLPYPSIGRAPSLPSMEGRAIARPNEGSALRVSSPNLPSMEGRAIARPNLPTESGWGVYAPGLQWRAGQLPGQTLSAEAARRAGMVLQWRAGQLPGQTPLAATQSTRSAHSFNGGPGNCPAKRPTISVPVHQVEPSMEGRAIARPNPQPPPA